MSSPKMRENQRDFDQVHKIWTFIEHSWRMLLLFSSLLSGRYPIRFCTTFSVTFRCAADHIFLKKKKSMECASLSSFLRCRLIFSSIFQWGVVLGNFINSVIFLQISHSPSWVSPKLLKHSEPMLGIAKTMEAWYTFGRWAEAVF